MGDVWTLDEDRRIAETLDINIAADIENAGAFACNTPTIAISRRAIRPLAHSPMKRRAFMTSAVRLTFVSWPSENRSSCVDDVKLQKRRLPTSVFALALTRQQ